LTPHFFELFQQFRPGKALSYQVGQDLFIKFAAPLAYRADDHSVVLQVTLNFLFNVATVKINYNKETKKDQTL
jgi:hypothetical protein